ncbi:MAG TPA: hypothetical protein VI547_14400 [Anaerolineales bacterium]|nr:hypothetical protein [Anaerolineales bacterium]
MPRPSLWLIRTALLNLAAGFTFGALLLFHKGVPISQDLWRLLPAHIEFMLIGWTMQFVMGVAFWILPRFIHGLPRGNERPLWIAYALLNAGVLTVGLGPVVGIPAALLLAGRVGELAATAIFATQMWPRVKALGL